MTCEGCRDLAARVEALEALLAASKPGIDPDALYTVEQAASRLGVGRSSLYEMAGDGSIAVIRTGRKKGFKVKGSDLTAFLESRREGGPSPARIDVVARLKGYLK